MRTNRILALAIASLFVTGAQAATSIRLEAASPTALLGSPFDVRIVADIDAADEIIGFGFDLFAPSSIGLLSFSAGPLFGDDPVYLATQSDADGIRGASAGDLLFGPPVSGMGVLLGTLKLQGLSEGAASISLSADDLSFFYTEGLIPLSISSTNFMPPVVAAEVAIVATNVPEPSTWVSLLAGLAVLGGWKARRGKKPSTR